jgi:DNA mismatch repair protein MutS2
LGREATVLAVEKDRLEVQVGLLRMDVDLEDVVLLAEAQPDPSKQRGSRHKLAGAMSVDPEIHLRGQTVDEALADLDRYLDHALLAGYDEVRVVHGKGTGTLRRAVHDYLKNHPHVERYEHPSDAQGGVGVTVAHFRSL